MTSTHRITLLLTLASLTACSAFQQALNSVGGGHTTTAAATSSPEPEAPRHTAQTPAKRSEAPSSGAMPRSSDGTVDWRLAIQDRPFDPAVCDSAAFQASCQELDSWLYQSSCDAQYVSFTSLEDVEEMRADLDNLTANLPRLDTYIDDHLGCSNTRDAPNYDDDRCYLSTMDLEKCETAQHQMQKIYREFGEDFMSTPLGKSIAGDIKTAQENPLDESTINNFPKRIALLDAIVALNTHPMLGTDITALEAHHANAHAAFDTFQKDLKAALLKVHCPSAGYTSRKLHNAFKDIVSSHLEADTPKRKLLETVRGFSLQGAPYAEYNTLERTTYEYADVAACTEQIRKDGEGEPVCRVFSVSLVRQKRDGGSWSMWGWHGLGGGGRMACSNLE